MSVFAVLSPRDERCRQERPQKLACQPAYSRWPQRIECRRQESVPKVVLWPPHVHCGDTYTYTCIETCPMNRRTHTSFSSFFMCLVIFLTCMSEERDRAPQSWAYRWWWASLFLLVLNPSSSGREMLRLAWAISPTLPPPIPGKRDLLKTTNGAHKNTFIKMHNCVTLS